MMCPPSSFWRFWQDATLSTSSPCCSSRSGSLDWRPGSSFSTSFFVSPFSAPDSISFSSQTFSSPSTPSPWWPPSTWLLPLLSKGAEHALCHNSIIHIHNCFCDTFQIWRVPIQVLGSLSSSGLQQDGNRCKFSSQVEILLFCKKKIFASSPQNKQLNYTS